MQINDRWLVAMWLTVCFLLFYTAKTAEAAKDRNVLWNKVGNVVECHSVFRAKVHDVMLPLGGNFLLCEGELYKIDSFQVQTDAAGKILLKVEEFKAGKGRLAPVILPVKLLVSPAEADSR